MSLTSSKLIYSLKSQLTGSNFSTSALIKRVMDFTNSSFETKLLKKRIIVLYKTGNSIWVMEFMIFFRKVVVNERFLFWYLKSSYKVKKESFSTLLGPSMVGSIIILKRVVNWIILMAGGWGGEFVVTSLGWSVLSRPSNPVQNSP